MGPYPPRSVEAAAKKLVHEVCMGVIGNGGLCYWYEGKSHEDTLRVAVGFERLLLGEQADAMRASLAAFPGGMPPQALGERQSYVSAHREELDCRFEALDETVSGTMWDAKYDVAAARYLTRRRAELLALEPRFRALLDEFAAADLKQ